jgi:hypothetical protein
MDEIVRKTVEKGFEEAIDKYIQNGKMVDPNEWNNNALFVIAIITSAIGDAKEVFKKMIKDNNSEFGIPKSEVDDFVEGLGDKMQKKYFINR